LKQSLEKLLDSSGFRHDSLYEPRLNEIVRRGDKTWEAFLDAKLNALVKKKFKLAKDSDDTESGSLDNLELLTALRRVQKKPDPLAVVLESQGPLEGTPLSLPRLKVAIKNVDCEKAVVGFTNGGEYRSGRQARWRLIARNSKGTELPVKERLSWDGGGMYQKDILEYGKSWETVLDVGSFVRIRQPGTYSLEVLYHDTRAIADESDINGRIVSQSKPITLIVRPLVIELTAREHKQAAEWIAALNAKQRLKVVAGTYGEWAHKFVPPTAPEGRLLGMGIKAVPALIEALGDRSLSDQKRAWILSLLFSATGENDPRNSSAVGEYDYQETGWQIWGGFSGKGPSGGLACPSEGSSSGGRIERKAQDELIGTWDDWLKTVEVREGGSGDRLKPTNTEEKRSR
jgi:hypothetical protein